MTRTPQKNSHSPVNESRIDRAELKDMLRELLTEREFLNEISVVLKSGGGEKEIMEAVKKRKKKVDDMTGSLF